MTLEITGIDNSYSNTKGDFMIVTIGSPDKISLGMFADFITSVTHMFPVADMHYLVSMDVIPDLIKEFLSNNSKDALFRYYANKKIEGPSIPSIFQEVSDAVIWFPKFSVDPTIIKDSKEGFLNGLIPRWRNNIERFSKFEQMKGGLPLI